MGKIVNWGIMATGKIAHTFAKAVSHAEGARLYACASRNSGKAAEFGALYGAEKSYGSYEEMAADENIDVIYVATPMSCHYENVKLCFEHNKNVLCEKSVTLNAAQLRELIGIAKEKNLFFMEAMWTKCLPAFRKAKEWAAAGKIGEIRAIRADFSNAVDFDPSDRLFRPELGGGALLDLSIYPLSLITSFLGFEPKEIHSAVNIGKLGVDMDEAVIMQYENAYASFVSGFDIDNENRAVIVGTEGRIAFNPWFFCTDTVRLYDKDNKPVEEFVSPHPCNGYEFEIYEVQECLSEGLTESRIIPLADSLAIMEIMDSLRNEWGFRYENE